MTDINKITGAVVNAAFRIHSELGPGLLESVYKRILVRDLARLGFNLEVEKPVSFSFEGLWFENAFRADLIVEKVVVVEVKSVVSLTALDHKQLLTYLRLLDIRHGLLLNFKTALIKDGIKRIVNGY